jgi:hypothetical protein
MKVLIVTVCGAKKNPRPMPAYKLYKSARIKAVYNRRSGCDMGILSAEYGLVRAHDVIEPYERLMDEKRAEELAPFVAEKLKEYDCIIFFKGGARKTYLSCIKAACKKIGRTLVALGYANMGGINDLHKVIELIKLRRYSEIPRIEHAEVYEFDVKS